MASLISTSKDTKLVNLILVICFSFTVTNSKEINLKIESISATDTTLNISYLNESNDKIYLDISKWSIEEKSKINKHTNSYNFGYLFNAMNKYNNSILGFLSNECEKKFLFVDYDLDSFFRNLPHIIIVRPMSKFSIEFKINPSDIKAFQLFDSLCIATEFVSIDIKLLKKFFSLIPTSQQSRLIDVESIQNNCIYVDANSVPFVIEKFTLNNDKILYLENLGGEISNDTKYFYQLLLTERIYLTYKIKSPYYIKEE